jgi:hypothetical protein
MKRYLAELMWLFLIMPLVGAAAAGWLFRARLLSAD